MLDRSDVPSHPERHLLTNHVGSETMHIEVGPSIPLAVFDTILLASDGVLDNMPYQDLIDGVRSGPLEVGADRIRDAARSAMRGEVDGFPAYPDDATTILYRRARKSRRSGR
jgi:serine/threonine protein phosphatase PrpC